jgi:hypothetical protein
MSEEHMRESGRGAGLIWFFLAAALLYVLSVGPAGALARKHTKLAPVVVAVYTPLRWLHDQTPLKEPLDAYGRLWGWE